MRIASFTFALLLAGLLAPVLAAEGAVKWTSDFEAAKKTAAEQKKRIFVDFMAEWCGPCKQLDAKVWISEDVAKRLDKEYVAVKIDVDENTELSKKYQITAMPTLLIADAEGSELARAVGAPFMTPEAAIKWFDEIGGSISAHRDLTVKWDESKHGNAEIGEKLAEAAKVLGRNQQVLEIYDALISLAGDDKARAASLHLKVAKLLLDAWDTEAASAHVEKADKLTPAEGDARIDLDLVRAKLLLYDDKPEEARKLADKYFDPLLARADARVIDLADVIMNTEAGEDEAALNKKGRDMYLKLAKSFEKHERVWELKVYAAWYGLSGDSKEAAKKELAEIAEKGEGQWKEIARSLLDGADDEDEDSDEDDGDMG